LDWNPLKLLRRSPPDPKQLNLQLDLFTVAEDKTPSTPATPVQVATPPAIPVPLIPSTPAVPPPLAPTIQSHKPNRKIVLGAHTLEYTLLRSKRRSIGFLINDEGLRVTAPKWVTIGEIEHAISEKSRWILTKLHEHRERSARRLQPQMQWCDGAKLPYLGQDICLRLIAQQQQGIVFDAERQILMIDLPENASEQQLKDRVQGWLQGQAKQLFRERLDIYAEKLGATYRAFALSSATTQWGSCTADGKIRLNWRLMHFSLPIIDYVVAHELAHLREMNHGPRFWETVQSIFPEFETAKKTLRNNGPETLPAF
jgi:predicted metal-dependent hydrolase